MKGKAENEIDALFKLPLAEFTGARNALAARLKKEGNRDEAERVKLLAKPPVSVWAVNQLYWEQREAFDELIATGRKLRATQTRGKISELRDSLEARREVLSHLTELAEELLREGGHNPSLDTLRRITTTLEAMSSYAMEHDGPTPGRLTQDLDPPSFESLASLMSGVRVAAEVKEPAPKKTTKLMLVRRAEEERQAKIAAAKRTLQEAKKSLAGARAKVQGFEAAQKKANAEAKDAEKLRREAEARLAKATKAAESSARSAQEINEEVAAATQALADAKRAIEEATRELETLLRQ